MYYACVFDAQDESWGNIPRHERPLPSELEGYEQRYEADPDYENVLIERGRWISDWVRETEEKREREADGREPLDTAPDREARTGYDETSMLQRVGLVEPGERSRY